MQACLIPLCICQGLHWAWGHFTNIKSFKTVGTCYSRGAFAWLFNMFQTGPGKLPNCALDWHERAVIMCMAAWLHAGMAMEWTARLHDWGGACVMISTRLLLRLQRQTNVTNV